MLQRVPKGHCAELTRRQIEVDELALVDRKVEFGADCGDGVGREFGSFGVYVLILQQPEEAAARNASSGVGSTKPVSHSRQTCTRKGGLISSITSSVSDPQIGHRSELIQYPPLQVRQTVARRVPRERAPVGLDHAHSERRATHYSGHIGNTFRLLWGGAQRCLGRRPV